MIEGPVGLIDVAPTLLELAGLPIPTAFAGRSLRAVIVGDDDGSWLEQRPIYVDVPNATSGAVALRRGPWKLVRRGERSELYHLGDDPAETSDLAAQAPDRVRALSAELDDWIGQMRATAAAEGTLAVPSHATHPAEQEAALRALGYVE